MMQTRIEHTGVVAELNGEYWGVQYEDGQCRALDFGPIDRAHVSDPRYCKTAVDMTYPTSPDIKKLAQADLLVVTITTVYEVESK